MIAMRSEPMASLTKNGDVLTKQSDREARMRALAIRLQFVVERTGDQFTLTRTVDVSSPERAEHLTLREAEELLGTWKLRGHGA